jgi:UDP-N-acetylmuramoylalanine--D-glutamate ligase
MRIALLGFDTEGKASYEYWRRQGAEITICDQKPDLEVPDGVDTQLGDGYLDDLDRFDVLVRTAGMPPRVILEKNPNVVAKITTHINEFLRVCPTRNIIGVTGTKGKGTTSTLITRMLEATGREVYLGGNIGVPPLTFQDKLTADSWVVLELSSFQLIDLQRSPHIGVCLMVVPEHLNWHQDMAEYKAAKSRLFEFQSSDDVAIYLPKNENSLEIASAGAGRKLPYYRSPGAWVNGNMITIDGTEICTTDELKLLGQHNWQNVCAALTAYWQVDQNIDAVRSVLTTFSGLEHRLEFVRELDGVRYYDDSFGTTPETAIVALQAFTEPKVVILGGSDKGASYDELAQAVTENNVRVALLIGEQAGRMQAALEKAGFNDYQPGGQTMAEIVANTRNAARDGDVVLLSTGCASFDMFANYKDRGNQFKEQVSKLV